MDDFDSIWWVLLLVFVLLSWLRGTRRRPPASPEAAGAGGVPATYRADRVEATARRLAELEARAEASLDAPDRREVIREAVQRSIVGVGTEERVARVRAMAAGPIATEAREAYARPESPWEAPAAAPTASEAHALASARARSPVLPLNAERLVDALLLAEIIEAPARRRRRV